MREELKKLNGQRTVFRGTFQRYGIRPVVLPPVKTFCLADIQNVEGIVLADHLWLNWRQTFSTLGELQEGQVVEFVATVTEYEKRRYRGNRKQVPHSGNGGTDYRLSYPANVRVIQ
jgi:hypothetical protein